MQKDEVDEIVGEIISNLDGQIRSKVDEYLLDPVYFDLFAASYNGEQITADTLRDKIYEQWIEKRLKLLDELVASWENWTYAWDNVDKKRF